MSWGKLSREKIKKYFKKNRGEALGFLEYQPRKHHLNRFLQAWQKQMPLTSAGAGAGP